MAEKKHEVKEGMGLGMIVLIFLVAIFIIWVLMGGSKKEQAKSLFMMPEPAEIDSTGGYGSSEN